MQNASRSEFLPVSQRAHVCSYDVLLAGSPRKQEPCYRGYPTRHYRSRYCMRIDLKSNTTHFFLTDIQDIAWCYEKSIKTMENIARRMVFSRSELYLEIRNGLAQLSYLKNVIGILK